MDKEIYLKLETYKGILTIPFPDIFLADMFTVSYSNMGELVESLIKMLGLEIEIYDVENVYLSFDKYNRGIDSECLPVKYSTDNFNFESLKDAFVMYLQEDTDRILSTDVRYVKSVDMNTFLETRMLNKYEIERLVRAFFGKGLGYKRKREIYFLLKDYGKFNILIDKVKMNFHVDRQKLSIYSNGCDDYLNYLLELSARSPEDFERAMDEIGQSDLEEVRELLTDHGYGIVDGVSNGEKGIKPEIMLLEETTGLSISKLRTNYVSFGRKRKK